MIFRIILLIFAVLALIINFQPERVLHIFTKRDSFEPNEIMRVKYIALGIMLLAVIVIFMNERGIINF